MDNSKLDKLQQAYKQAVDQWVNTIRAEEGLATDDHSETAMERWDQARLRGARRTDRGQACAR